MHRELPVSNKKLSKLWNEKNFSTHISHLRNIKSRVDIRTPCQFSHLKFKAKTYLIQENRFSEIDRENRLLLEKINHISASNSRKRLPVITKSLNQDLRKRKLLQIAIENQAMVKRLSQKNSMYNSNGFKLQRKKVEKMLSSICEYPYTLGSTQKLMSKSQSKQSYTPKSSQDTRKLKESKDYLFKDEISLKNQRIFVEIERSEM